MGNVRSDIVRSIRDAGEKLKTKQFQDHTGSAKAEDDAIRLYIKSRQPNKGLRNSLLIGGLAGSGLGGAYVYSKGTKPNRK